MAEILMCGFWQTRRAALTSTVLLASLAAPVWAEPEKLEKLKRIAQDGVDNSSSPLVQSEDMLFRRFVLLW